MNSVDPKERTLWISLKWFFLISSAMLFCLTMPFSGYVLGGQHEVQVDFSFDVDAVPGKVIAGYRLYMEGQEVCNTGPVDPQNITCMVSADDGTYDFTLAARYDDDSLSPQSAAVPFTITTEAMPPPVITLIGVNPQIVERGTAYMELGAIATDVAPGDLTGELVIDASALDTNTVGSYLVTYNVTDGAGNQAVEVMRAVTVQDTTPPVITLVGANTQQLEVGTAYMELGATATDLVSEDLTGAVVIDASAVDTNKVGSYVVTYNVTDGAGNAAVEVTRAVNMITVDTTPPVITLAGANHQIVERGEAYMELGAIATDVTPGDLTGELVIDASAVDTTTMGSYLVTYNVTDGAGNPAVEVTRTVTVQDTTPPVITLVGANSQIVERGTGYMELGATATDLVPGDLTGVVVIDDSAVDSNTVGSYVVTYNVTDGAGHAAVEVTRTVMVVIDELSDVTILDAWVVDGSYATQDAIFNVSAGTDRIVLVGLSAEKNGNGPITVTSVSLGDQELTEVFDFTVGSSGAYHNLHWLGYLLESEIAARSGSELTVTYANQPSNPFDEPKIHYASYEHVDQTTPIADSDSNVSTNASSLQLINALVAGDGDKIVGLNVLGQHYAPGLSTSGHTEETESIGATNGHASAAYQRPATTSVTANPMFTSATATRMAVSAVVLKAAGIDNNPPVPVIAIAAADPTSGVAPFSVTLNGNGSSGPITGYSWIFGDGDTGNGISTTHLYQAAGTYTATLTVTAADGTTYNDTVVITVSEPPPPPVASISPQSATGVAPFTVQFDGNNCTGTINSYSWSFGDGAGGSGQSASHTYQTPGTYTATLTVAGAGTTSMDSVTIEVSAQPEPPVAIISSTSALGDAPLAVTFDGTESTATQMPLSYHWDFGDGATASVPAVGHNYNNPGDFTAILTVTDSAGLTDTASTPVMVNTPPVEENQPPVSSFTLSSSTGVAPLLVTFDGNASDDPDGSIASYLWTFADGSTQEGETCQCEFTEAGEYVVSLTVTDNDGDTAVSSQAVTVEVEEEIDLFIEISEIQIDSNWTPVSFSKPFNDPVVIAGPPGFEDSDPATVRIRNLTQSGFEIRVQEWDYLDDSHAHETVSFIVIDKGVYTLENGTKMEAGSFSGTSKFESVNLQQTYNFKPVILEQVMTEQDQDAVTGRIRNVSQSSFDFKLQEQETTKATHANETIGYIAWEPGTGSLGGLDYEVGSSGKYVKHTWYSLSFQNQAADAPLFMADSQTQGGGDTAVVRTQQINNTNVQIKVEEEQSKDSETRHVKEEVGYLAIIGSPN